MIQADLTKAQVPIDTDEGVADFHACRVAYVSFVIEAGATVKEAQSMARHSNPDLTLNVYARAKEERLSELAEKVGDMAFSGKKRAPLVHQVAAGAEGFAYNTILDNAIQLVITNSEGGIRTHYLSLMRRPL